MELVQYRMAVKSLRTYSYHVYLAIWLETKLTEPTQKKRTATGGLTNVWINSLRKRQQNTHQKEEKREQVEKGSRDRRFHERHRQKPQHRRRDGW